MRIIKLDSNNEVIEVKYLKENYVLGSNEFNLEVGELGQIMQSDESFIDFITPLEQVRSSKLIQINDKYNQTLSEGFNSTATGTPHTFGYGQSDREKFIQLAISVLSNIATFPVPIPTKDGEIVLHDQMQYQQLLGDISAFAWTMQVKLQTLTGQAKEATTVDKVNEVVW